MKEREIDSKLTGETISLENQKLEWLIKHEEENGEDLNFFRSLVPYMKQLPPTKKKKKYS